MKLGKLIIVLTILWVGLLALQCMVITPTITEITVLWDVTDTTIGKPKSDEILPLYHLDGEDVWNGALFRISTLSNVNFNPTEELTLPPRNKWLSNELQRQKEIGTFKSQIALSIDAPQTEDIGRSSSSLYWPVFIELKRLAEQTGERRIMVIQSDLMENSADLSLYDPKQLKAFTTDPTSVKYLTENIAQLPPLKGIEVYMIYRPMNTVDSERYTLISEVLTNLLQEKGAKVYRSANLIR